ncbi:MAG: hypothetical protein GY854_33085 [Deltaproteobacteria bacterium]|nr:hypothetical protein [Deltaproteobacteria bacterium]
MTHFKSRKSNVFTWSSLFAFLVLSTSTIQVSCRGNGSDAALESHKHLLQDGPISDPSFEITKERDKFGLVFPYWDGWRYKSDAEFRVSNIAHTGKSSCLMVGSFASKIRMFRRLKGIEPGRYKITAYIRGVNIGKGQWKQTTEFAFDDNYFPLDKNGTFGWTPITYVTEVTKKDFVGPSVGLMAPGYLWVDDVKMQKMGPDVPLTDKPRLGEEEAPIKSPVALGDQFIRCPVCDLKNIPKSKNCFACGAAMEEKSGRDHSDKSPPVKLLASFENKDPFSGGDVVEKRASDGTHSLMVEDGYVAWEDDMDWSAFDDFTVDLHAESKEPMELKVEIRDKDTTGYWTRVNIRTIVLPGKSTLTIPLGQLYVGEKSRPGRHLKLSAITKIVFGIGDDPKGVLYIDNIRLSRDTTSSDKLFNGLNAFDFGKPQSPLMPGFKRIDTSLTYTEGRGYGLKDAKIWRTFDALQPDPLYQDFICIEKGGLVVDVANGKYVVFVNMDNPSGYWGEFQLYRERSIIAEGKTILTETMDFDSFRAKYFRHWNVDDNPSDNTFDKYVENYFNEKQFEVDVTDGQLNLEFSGRNWSCSVSAVIVFPVDSKDKGTEFLDYIKERRRFFFDASFKRSLHLKTDKDPALSDMDKQRGYTLFARDYMEEVYYNDRPKTGEKDAPVKGAAFAGEIEPLTLSITPLLDIDSLDFTISDLVGPGTIPASSIAAGIVSYRLSRETHEGTVYTIKPRLVIPGSKTTLSKGVTKRLWFTVEVPSTTPAGNYKGSIILKTQDSNEQRVPVQFRVYKGTLASVDIPVGPWGHNIRLPWYDRDPQKENWERAMNRRALEALRKHGFTTFSGMPTLRYRGFENGKPKIDYTVADKQMKMAREVGFSMPVVNYNQVGGFDLYNIDDRALRRSGISDYAAFLKLLFSDIQSHANANNWLPVYWNIGDEPAGGRFKKSLENAKAYRRAFPSGPPYFTIATSYASKGPFSDDEHYTLAKTVNVANLMLHDEDSVEKLQSAGGSWGYYNDGNRWTMGIYLYKAAKQHNLKFRLDWHWNKAAGDPYYALDCREDDWAWANATPDGELVYSVRFNREIREGLDDYRYLLTLAKEASLHSSDQARKLLDKKMDAFELGQNRLGEKMTPSDWKNFRHEVASMIEKLRSQ